MIANALSAALALLVGVQPAAPIVGLPDCVRIARTVLVSAFTRPLIWENGRPVVAIYRMRSGQKFVLSFTWTDDEPCLVDAG